MKRQQHSIARAVHVRFEVLEAHIHRTLKSSCCVFGSSVSITPMSKSENAIVLKKSVMTHRRVSQGRHITNELRCPKDTARSVIGRSSLIEAVKISIVFF